MAEAPAPKYMKMSPTGKPVTRVPSIHEGEKQNAERKEVGRELDAMTSRVLDAHLRDIMIKVWQALPDDPSTDEEKEVAEKFRNQVGDDLRNVLGLNATKRLLNVHNSLYVKLEFSSCPAPESLDKLLSQFNLTALKRQGGTRNVFAAQFKNIKDFDQICAHHTFKCGGVKVTATPCYRFIQCPSQLKTKYVVKDDTEPCNKEETKVAVKMVSEKTFKPAAETQTVNIAEVTLEPKDINIEKASNFEVETVKLVASNKNDTTKIDKSTTKLVGSKVIVKQEANVEVKTKIEKVEVKPKVNIEKLNSTNAEPKKIVKQNIEVFKEKPKISTIIKTIKKEVAKPELKPSIKIKPKIEIESDEIPETVDVGDEMDDEEILQLLSGGIVLDECGSDDD